MPFMMGNMGPGGPMGGPGGPGGPMGPGGPQMGPMGPGGPMGPQGRMMGPGKYFWTLLHLSVHNWPFSYSLLKRGIFLANRWIALSPQQYDVWS